METKFKVGDKVEAFGVCGVIENIDDTSNNLSPIFVSFENYHCSYFTMDGKQATWHETPSLTLVKSAKKTVELQEYNFCSKSYYTNYYRSEEDAKMSSKEDYLGPTGRTMKVEVADE